MSRVAGPLEEECFLAVRRTLTPDAYIEAGQRVHRSHPVLEQHSDRFVPIAPPGLEARNALRAKTQMAHSTSDGTGDLIIDVHAGQWVPRDSPLIERHRFMFEEIE